MDITHITSLLGGVALFLYGMSIMGAGLEKLAGGKMQGVLQKLTSSTIKGVIFGTLITGVIQSSAGTVVICVGLVNSGIMHIENGKYNYAMSILKSDNGNPDSCLRFTYAYENPLPGEGRFIHTYMHDGNPLPSFQGEPKLVEISDDMDAFTDMLWNSLNEDNKVSLFVRFIDIETGKYETRIINKNV